MDGWMDDLQFYVVFNSNSVISGQWADDNERLCAMEPHLLLKRSSPGVGHNSLNVSWNFSEVNKVI